MCDLVVAYIGLGANLGHREATLREAVRQLGARRGIEVTAVSLLRETMPVGGPPQGNYLNGVAQVRTSLTPLGLLRALQETEAEFGRKRTVRWGPRTLDLDLLLYGDAVVNAPGLRVPHPHMHQRRFVLEPLCDIAPDVVHPTFACTVAELLAQLPAET